MLISQARFVEELALVEKESSRRMTLSRVVVLPTKIDAADVVLLFFVKSAK